MARLTRNGFAEQVVGLFGAAANALRRDGRVHTVLLGYDASGVLRLSVLFADPDAAVAGETASLAQAADVTVLPGDPEANRETLAVLIAERQVVAAVLIVEAWVAGGDTAQDVVATGMLVSEHPAREETVLLVGHYPREVLTQVVAGRIVRDAGGRPSVQPWPDGVLTGHMAQPAIALLDDLLPGLPGRGRSGGPAVSR